MKSKALPGGPRGSIAPARDPRMLFAIGVSGLALATMLAAQPVRAQLAAFRAAAGLPNVAPAAAPTPQGTVINPGMNALIARAAANAARASNTAALIAQANAAARAAAAALQQTVTNGLGQGGLEQASDLVVAAQDATGLHTWQGASQPVQQSGANGAVTVTITQTDQRALLSWNTFNVGRDTTLVFDQKAGGVAQPGWVAVNRVVAGIDPATGRTTTPTPSQILGSIKADGTVMVLNQGGVLFGPTAQVNLHALLVSSLELGAPSKAVNNTNVPTTLKERNSAFLQNGLIGAQPTPLVSAVGEAGDYGDVVVASGAQINSTGAGFVILTAPRVASAGMITADTGGQVSLQSGQQVDAFSSTGAAESFDPNVRGLVLASAGKGSVEVSGSIDVPQGYISLGSSELGTTTLSGVLTSTTSVSRNGKVSVTGGTVELAPDAVIAIRPDSGSETIPQSADSVAAFKTSQVEIGSYFYEPTTGTRAGTRTDLLPADITLGTNSLIYAPSATVAIGAATTATTHTTDERGAVPSRLDIQDGATIDVSGVANVLLPASRNSLAISPAKRNELRDTPTYRDVTTDGSFTLNGQTLYVDLRVSGVRADGVAWIGSPLLEAGSLAAQIGVTAQELMTKGGNVTLGVRSVASGAVLDPELAPSVTIANGATIDVSGGWVQYQAGSVRTSRLITDDGRMVDIGAADPNDTYVAVSNGFTQYLPQLSKGRTFANVLLQGRSDEPAYAEGRDAGTLTISAPIATVDGTIHGDAFAGSRQIADARVATKAATLPGDVRTLQNDYGQLPSGALLRIQGLSVGSESSPTSLVNTASGDIVIAHAGETVAAPAGATLLRDDMINGAGLSGLVLQSSGAVSFTRESDVALAAGGALQIDAGRTITFDGRVEAAGGSITARTYAIPEGSLFTEDDDQPAVVLAAELASGSVVVPSLYDIVVNGTLSTAGRWVNDSLVTDGSFGGAGYTNGGSISLTVAPHVGLKVDNATDEEPDAEPTAVDISGSILINDGARLDVSSGGYVARTGETRLTAKGGNISLINETTFAQTSNVPQLPGDPFMTSLSAFQVTPDDLHLTALTPDFINARVDIADGSIIGFGFGGGGIFTLVSPDLNFGDVDGESGTVIPIDFLDKTGFGGLSLTSWNTRIIPNVFSNGRTGKTALLGTERLVINEGQTLDLTQTVLPTFLSQDQLFGVRALATGARLADLSGEGGLLERTKPTIAYDQLPVSLTLGGLTELDVLAGGQIIGAAGASITAPRLYSDGTIRIVGGTITQKLVLPSSYTGARAAFGVRSLAEIFGPADENGLFDEDAQNAKGVLDSRNRLVSNRDLVSRAGADRQVYLVGLVDADTGIELTGNSVTDLSGASILNPHSEIIPGGVQRRTGNLVAGGSIRLLGNYSSNVPDLFTLPVFGSNTLRINTVVNVGSAPGQTATRLAAESGAQIGLAGAADDYDIALGGGDFVRTAQWSKGGTLSLLGGGTIAGAQIDARGGAAAATAGTLEWFNPILRQVDADGDGDGVSAASIAAAGFDSFVAHGVLTGEGDVTLALGRSFLLRSIDFNGSIARPADYQIAVEGDGRLAISAPYIGFDSALQSTNYPSLPATPPKTGTGSGGATSPTGGTSGGKALPTGEATFSGGTIDVRGAVAFGPSLTKVGLDSSGDLRLTGVPTLAQTFTPSVALGAQSLSGQIVFGGDALLRASQIYATTGTGNLQQIADGAATATPFLIGSVGADATIRFERSGTLTPALPLSAGTYVAVQATHIEQAGILRAPLGRIDLGVQGGIAVTVNGSTLNLAAPETVALEKGSQTTVSANGLNIPYGTTTDLTEYFFSPNSSAALRAPPGAELRMAGDTIDIEAGATVDATGGGDLFAYEFVSGVGGSRDLLSRFNGDAFSGNDGYQYPDQRQVYAIVPGLSSEPIAAMDPIYSADYADLYGSNAGRSVYLDGVPGLAAGYYTLLPAHYALLPGGYRVVENPGGGMPAAGSVTTLLDGSYVVSGKYGISGTNLSESTMRSFVVQTAAVVGKYSNLQVTGGTKTFTDIANSAGVVTPQLPFDAARVVLAPISGLTIGEKLLTNPASGGRGAKVDISGDSIDLVSVGTKPRQDVVTLTTGDIANLSAASLLIGGTRVDRLDGTTDVSVTSHAIRVATSAADPLQAPEIVLAVDGLASTLTIADGSSIVASGDLVDTRSGDYNVMWGDATGMGSFLRLASSTERLVDRSGPVADKATNKKANLTIGAASFTGGTLTLETSKTMKINTKAIFATPLIAIGADTIAIAEKGGAGVLITPTLEAQFAAAQRLTLRSPNIIGIQTGTHNFKDLVIDAYGIRALRPVGVKKTVTATLTINAGNVTLLNSGKDRGDCKGNSVISCGSTDNWLKVNATTITFGDGVFHTYGFDDSVGLTATQGAYYEGVGTFDTAAAPLTITTPFLVDRALKESPLLPDGSALDPVQPSLTIATSGAVTIKAPAGAAVAPIGNGAPGAKLEIGTIDAPAASIAINGALLRATAGTLDLRANRDIALTNAASLSVPGYSRTFGNDADQVTVSAAGGALNLVSLNGNINVGAQASLSIGGGKGQAGSLLLAADRGAVALAGKIDAAAPAGGGSFALESGLSAFDFASFVQNYGAQFTGDISVQSGAGDLVLDTGQALKVASLSLTADGGGVSVRGNIDTSGANGGDIGLYGATGVTLASGAVIDAHADGYGATDARQAQGGDVTLGTAGTGTIAVASGATIDVGARQSGNRLIAQTRVDPITLANVTAYSFVSADTGGTLTLRAPVIDSNHINLAFQGKVAGASEIVLQGYKRFDLAALAADPNYTGVSINAARQAVLDLTSVQAGRINVLADTGAGTLVDFVQNFDISGTALGTLAGNAALHERPEMVLDYAGGISLASNWNLGAGTVDVDGAVAAGLMRPSSLGPYADGTPRYEVVPGQEAAVFERFTSLTYRVGGRVDGEAPQLTLRAGAALDISHSISDGFFAFADQTDPDYISFQLGGGARSFQPGASVTCSTFAGGVPCANIQPFAFDTSGARPRDPSASQSINIRLAPIVRGSEILAQAAPYSAAANAPGATGLGVDGAGDPFGTAQMFPLLADGSPIGSSSIRLVGGAGTRSSVNPLRIDRATAGSVKVSGETTYKLAVGPRSASYAGDFQLIYSTAGDLDRDNMKFYGSDFLANILGAINLNSDTKLDAETLGTLQTRIAIGGEQNPASAFLRSAAEAYYADHPGQAEFFGPTSGAIGFTTSLASAIDFLQSRDASGMTFVERYAEAIETGALNIPAPTPLGGKLTGPNLIRVPTLVRTGTGSIEIAAGGDVDLRQGDKIIYRSSGGGATGPNGAAGAQVGGSAVYTAGHVVVPHLVTATVAGTNQILTVDPSAYALVADQRTTDYIPYGDGDLQVNPVYADGGGSIRISAARDVIAQQDVWSEIYGQRGPSQSTAMVGSLDQRWRVGLIGYDEGGKQTLATNIRINTQQFSAGIGTLGGGDIRIDAGRDVTDLTLVVDTSMTTATIGSGAIATFGSMTWGGGSALVNAGRDVRGGRYDIASGTAAIHAGGSIGSAGLLNQVDGETNPSLLSFDNLPQLRLTDATLSLTATGTIDIGGIGALGVRSKPSAADAANAAGFYTGTSGVSLLANGAITVANRGTSLTTTFDQSLADNNPPDQKGVVLPGSLAVTSVLGDITLDKTGTVPIMLYPSAIGQLALYAGGTIDPVTLSMDDGDPSLLPGIFSAYQPLPDEPALAGRPFGLPLSFVYTPDRILRLYHNQNTTHVGDSTPVQIAVGNDLRDVSLYLPKQARVSAGRDIVNMYFSGQNLASDDVTRITAGRDITATTALSTTTATPLAVVQGNQFVLGGPGALFVEAGRNLGPFLNSAAITSTGQTFAGGILTVGNNYNPWMPSQGASIYTFFGIAKGADFDALRDTYVDPANAANLDGDLFVPITDINGNKTPDRNKPIYGPALVAWLLEHDPKSLVTAFGGSITLGSGDVLDLLQSLDPAVREQFLVDLPYLPAGGILSAQVAIDRTSAAAPVLITDASAVASAPSGQKTYISGSMLIGWLAQNEASVLTNRFKLSTASVAAAYSQFTKLPELRQRQALLDSVYFNELAAPSRPDGTSYLQYVRGYRAVDTLFPAALGYTSNDLTGARNGGTRIVTGNLDLRLATIQTERGGDVTILAPGGNAILGSVVATATQAARRAYPIGTVTTGIRLASNGRAIDSIPIGYEGVLTLRGGAIRGFSDGDFRLNQSRLFTQEGGDIVLWSSNGDLNAGQGPKSAANFPPITVRFGQNGSNEVDSAGSVAGAGIAAFQPRPDIAAPSVTLIAPAGTVDAGDAGVRAAGDVFVAAARVANADNFKVGGQSIGVPSLASAPAAVTPASAAAAVVANVFRANAANGSGDDRTRISVDVLGYLGTTAACQPSDPTCQPGGM